MCGPYLYSTTHPPASLHQFMTDFIVQKELERWSVRLIPYSFGKEHEEVRSRDQWTLLANILQSQVHGVQVCPQWNSERDHLS